MGYRYSTNKINKILKKKGKKYEKLKNSQDYKDFIRASGGKSGVYDISDKKTAVFVRKYRKFIPKKEIYKRNKKGWLVPVYKQFKFK